MYAPGLVEQGNLAAISGHGISVGDLLLSLETIKSGMLAMPFCEAVATGDSYYLVWPKNTLCKHRIELLYDWFISRIPTEIPESVQCLR